MKEFSDPYIQEEYDLLLEKEYELKTSLEDVETRINEIESNEEQL